jgi:hypothetical protein
MEESVRSDGWCVGLVFLDVLCSLQECAAFEVDRFLCCQVQGVVQGASVGGSRIPSRWSALFEIDKGVRVVHQRPAGFPPCCNRPPNPLRGAGVRRRMVVSTTCVEGGPRGGELREGSVLTEGGDPHYRPTSKVPARRLLASRDIDTSGGREWFNPNRVWTAAASASSSDR